MHVCDTAVDALADSSKFPEEWLFKHRWGKGKKDAPTTLPSGEKITFLTVGGRTSCVVPSVQKKTGAVAGDLKTEKNGDSETKEPSKKRKTTEDEAGNAEVDSKVNGKGRRKKSEAAEVKAEGEDVPKNETNKRKDVPKAKNVNTTEPAGINSKAIAVRRRSGRVSK